MMAELREKWQQHAHHGSHGIPHLRAALLPLSYARFCVPIHPAAMVMSTTVTGSILVHSVHGDVATQKEKGQKSCLKRKQREKARA